VVLGELSHASEYPAVPAERHPGDAAGVRADAAVQPAAGPVPGFRAESRQSTAEQDSRCLYLYRERNAADAAADVRLLRPAVYRPDDGPQRRHHDRLHPQLHRLLY